MYRKHWRVIAAIATGLILLGLAPVTPAHAKTNAKVLNAVDWLSGDGVDVYSNDGSYDSAPGDYNTITIDDKNYRTGLRWQCVELVLRLYYAKGWIQLPGNPNSFGWSVPTGAYEMYGTAPAELQKEPNGSIDTVKAGDVIVFGGGWGGYGHVAVVNGVTDIAGNKATVNTVNQNIGTTAASAQKSFTWDKTAKTITAWSDYSTIGVVHAPGSASGTPALPTGSSPIKNGGFNADTSHWSANGSANLAHYTAATGGGTKPYEGSGFAASNGAQAGDSIAETNVAGISASDTYCASAEVVTMGPGGGSSGTLALWLLGGSNDVSTYRYTNLPGANNWRPIKTCVMATGSRSQIRVQFYPDPGSPTVGIDAVDVHQTLNASGGFNNGGGYWNLQPGTNFTTYTAAHAVGTTPYEGAAFGATNSSQSGGGLMQDLPRNIKPGDSFCVESKVVTVGNTTGAAGSLAIFLTGTTATEQSVYHFSNLPGGNAWSGAKACVRASSQHSNIRVQVYPAVGAPTLGVDALDVHASIALNGGFNVDSTHWSPNGALGYAQFANYLGTLPYEGTGFEVMQTNQPGASLSESRGYAWAPGDTFCAEASLVTAGTTSGGGGVLALHLISPDTTVTSAYNFVALPAMNAWTRAKTCVKASAGTQNGVIKVELYPSANNLPIGVDAVDVH